MKILLTGASGFIGKNFLLQYGDKYGITAVYRDNNFPDFLNKYKINCRDVEWDLTTENVFPVVLRERYDVCLHLAARVLIPQSVAKPIGDIQDNIIGTANLIKQIDCKRFIHVSSGAVYDGLKGSVNPAACLSPTLPYAINKLAAEHYVKYGYERLETIGEYVILRFWGAYGPHEPSFKIYTKMCRAFGIEDRSEFKIFGNGNNLIDGMYIEDAVDGMNDVVCQDDIKNTIYDFASGKPLSIKGLVKKAGFIIRGEYPEIVCDGIAHDNIHFQPSPDKFNQDFGFQPTTPLAIGLTNLLEHLEREESD